jgi:hypothetical protein
MLRFTIHNHLKGPTTVKMRALVVLGMCAGVVNPAIACDLDSMVELNREIVRSSPSALTNPMVSVLLGSLAEWQAQ